MCLACRLGHLHAAEFETANPRACGPIAVFVAYHAIGLPADLNEITRKCNLSTDGSVALKELSQLMQLDGRLVVSSGKYSQAQLNRHLDRVGVAIIAVKAGSVNPNHAICLTGRDITGDYVFVDSKAARSTLPEEQLMSIWEGDCIAISPSTIEYLKRELPFLVIPTLVSVAAAVRVAKKLFSFSSMAAVFIVLIVWQYSL